MVWLGECFSLEYKICRQSEQALKGPDCLWRKVPTEGVNVSTAGV